MKIKNLLDHRPLEYIDKKIEYCDGMEDAELREAITPSSNVLWIPRIPFWLYLFDKNKLYVDLHDPSFYFLDDTKKRIAG
jgi:hypothetical protein